MIDYPKLAARATQLINAFGVSAKINTIAGQSQSCKVVFLPTAKTATNDTNLIGTEKLAIIANMKIAPVLHDQLNVGKEVFVIGSVESFAPDAATNMYYKVTLKS